jgi:hypothetical protein
MAQVPRKAGHDRTVLNTVALFRKRSSSAFSLQTSSNENVFNQQNPASIAQTEWTVLQSLAVLFLSQTLAKACSSVNDH